MTQEKTLLYLSRADVEKTGLPMQRIIDAVEMSLIEKAHGRVQMPSKHWMEPRPTRWFGGMSSLVPATGYAAMKWQSGSTENAAKGRPYLTGMLFLNSIEEGLVDVVMDSSWLTQQRTAAESAVAVRHLAKAGADRYAQLGCGVQARSHFEAFRLVMPRLAELVVYDSNPAAAQRFAREVEAAGMRANVVDSSRAAIDAADIVVSAGPIEPDLERTIDASWLHPGLLGIAIDYDCYWKKEALAAADLLLTDDIGQIEHIKEYGYFVGCPEITRELGQVAAGLIDGRGSDDDTVIVCNMGVSVEDVATAKEIYQLALAQSIGKTLDR